MAASKWTLEKLKKVAKNYHTRTEFHSDNQSAYQAARKKGVLDQICVHMKSSRPSRGTAQLSGKPCKTITMVHKPVKNKKSQENFEKIKNDYKRFKSINHTEMRKDSFGNLIYQYRVSSGLTQDELARALGYSSNQFISNWERGLSHPPQNIIKKLVKILEIEKDQVINAYINYQNSLAKLNVVKFISQMN